MKWIIALFFISFNSYAKSPFCSFTEAKKAGIGYKYYEFISDKHLHCSYSCYIAFDCGKVSSFGIGLLKEIVDLFTPGDADKKDLEANLLGIKLSEELEYQDDCADICLNYY